MFALDILVKYKFKIKTYNIYYFRRNMDHKLYLLTKRHFVVLP